MASLILLPSSILTWRVYSLCCSLSTASFSSALSDSHSTHHLLQLRPVCHTHPLTLQRLHCAHQHSNSVRRSEWRDVVDGTARVVSVD